MGDVLSPVENSCNSLTLVSLPDDFGDFVLEQVGNYSPSAAFYTYCHREFFHTQWLELLDDEFVEVYQHGIALVCADGIARHLFLHILTYSADYPEK